MYEGKKILVVGLARTGLATVEFLLRQGADVTVNDRQTEGALASSVQEIRSLTARLGKPVRFYFGGHPVEAFTGADLILVSPGVPMAIEPIHIARNAGVEIIGELELAFRHLRGRVVGITGSNGKTTTTTLTGALLKAAGRPAHLAGNIGFPLIGFADASQDDDIYVTEISSFQLEGIDRFRPYVGALLNITPNHMDRYESFEAYAQAKYNLFRNQTPDDYAILNADNATAMAALPQIRGRVILFSRTRELPEGLFLRQDRFIHRDGRREQTLLSLSDIPLKGVHNRENVLAALAVGLIFGVDPEVMRHTVRHFPGVEHRLEYVATINGAEYYNDSKATSVDATIKVIETFDGNILLILGGKDKGGDFTALRPALAGRVKQVLLIGAATEKIASALEGCVPITRCTSMADVVEKAAALAVPGDVVALAPACASFDMFENYEHRGRVFKQEVLHYKESSHA